MNATLRIVRSPAPAPSPEAGSTLAGVVDALLHDPAWAGVLGNRDLDQRIVFRSAPPFGDRGRVGTPVDECDADEIRLWFEEAGGAPSPSTASSPSRRSCRRDSACRGSSRASSISSGTAH